MTFWSWLQKSTKSCPEVSFWWLWCLSGFGAWNRQKQILKFRFNAFMGSAPVDNKINRRSIDLMMALVPDVAKINARSLDSMTFWPWLQKSTISFPEASIWWLYGLGFRSQQNQPQKFRFADFLALAPGVDKDKAQVGLAVFVILFDWN